MSFCPPTSDQKDVMRRLEDKGAGVRLDKDASANTIHSTIIEVQVLSLGAEWLHGLLFSPTPFIS